VAFEGLRPGDYTLKLTGVAGNCTVNGSATLNFPVARLDDLAKAFSLNCHAGIDLSKPVVWQSRWTPASTGSGQKTALDIGLDMTAAPTQAVAGAQSTVVYDQTVVRLDSARAQGPWQASFNTLTPGRVTWVAFVTGSGVTGSLTFVRLYFTAIGSAGTTTTTVTTITALADGGGASILDLARKVEGTFTVGTGAGNQAPVSHPGGPYTGTVGSPVNFSGSGSSDPDGTISTYAWTFGDGASGTGATPSHSYAASGVFTVGLTVTDNAGGTNQATTSVTITGDRGGNQDPVARPGGPYTGLVGTPLQFDGSTSSDPDGSIASYAWTFGDGGSATGVSPTHSYAVAGSYTVTLIVTDNQGATGQASTTATASAGTGHPFTWQSSFGPVNPADSMVTLTISLDLSTDIAETSGPEALGTWAVDSLKWDPAVLHYFSFNFGAGGGSVNPTDAGAGMLTFNGTQSTAANSGVVPIATIRFKVIGPSGSGTQTTTALGPLLGTAATGFFSYGSRTAVVESGVQAP
jgi:PKD repeat protein